MAEYRTISRRPFRRGRRSPAKPAALLFWRRRRRTLENRECRHHLDEHHRRPTQDIVRRRDRRGSRPIPMCCTSAWAKTMRAGSRSRTAMVFTNPPTRAGRGNTSDSTRLVPSHALSISPANPDLVYVAAQGATFGATKDRGVYRSKDGGATWQNVLFVNETTGPCELAMDPTNPRILYAAFWDHLRKPWEIRSGGPGSGIYKSIDGGDTWQKINEGLAEADRQNRDLSFGESRAAIRDRRGRSRRRRLSLRQREADLDADELYELGAESAVLVLHEDFRRYEKPRCRVGAERERLALDRRRTQLDHGSHAARRQSRPVDQSVGSEQPGRSQRRRRERIRSTADIPGRRRRISPPPSFIASTSMIGILTGSTPASRTIPPSPPRAR